jgi:DNA repair exonuclease SbcCD ATPase subunit
MRYRLKQIEIESFRGVRDPLKIPLDSPLVVIFAPNGAGKSTITTAIEWALFPKEAVLLGHHNIRERTDWEIQHIHGDKEPRVRLALTDGSQDCIIEQSSAKQKKKRDVQFDKRPVLNGSYADFNGLAYIHQETLRDILIGQPKPRQDAFQRLLGAGWVQDLAEKIDEADKRLRCSDSDQRVDSLNEKLDAHIQEAARLLKQEEEAASQAGLNKPWQEQGQKQVHKVSDAIKGLCKQLEVKVPELSELSGCGGFKTYSSKLQPIMNDIRMKGPAGRHTELSAKKTKMEGARSSFNMALEARNDKRKDLETKEKEVGTKEEVDQSIQTLTRQKTSLEGKLENISREHSIMQAALDYFRTNQGVKSCPACLGEVIPPDIVERLQQRLVAESTTQEVALQSEIAQLDAQLRSANQHIVILNALGRAFANSDLQYSTQLQSLETAFGRTIKADESPLQLADAEIEVLGNLISAIDQAVRKLQTTVSEIEEEARKVDSIGKVIALQQRVENLGQMRTTSEWREMINSQQKLAQREQALSICSIAIRQFAAKFAEQNLDRARQPISTIFGLLTKRADFPNVSIDPQKKYAIEVSGNSGSQKLTAILNQSDMDALAIAVVAGMATTFPEVHDFDFLILDDPSQGMDPDVKARLADVIGGICEQTQVVVTTADPAMFQSLCKSTKKKRLILLKARDVESSAPFVQVESISGD